MADAITASTQAFSAFSREARQLRTLFEWTQYKVGWSLLSLRQSGIANRSMNVPWS